MTDRPIRHDNGRNCGTCQYWQPDDRDVTDGVQGTCHKNPPQLVTENAPLSGSAPYWLYPRVTVRDWCGKYKSVDEL